MADAAADYQRFVLQRQNFDRALARLSEALQITESEIVRDALIQRFEFTFEMAWKTMYRFLTAKGERIARKAWDVLPVAFEALLIDDPDVWGRMRDYRNDTAHEYDKDKAVEVAAFVRSTAYAALLKLQAEMARR